MPSKLFENWCSAAEGPFYQVDDVWGSWVQRHPTPGLPHVGFLGKDRSGSKSARPPGEGVRVARRNNLALARIVMAASIAGAGPQDLEVFGVKANGTAGALTICMMVLACHAYWYFMRWHHLADDAVVLVFATPPVTVSLRHDEPRMLTQKAAALHANRICFLLVLMSIAATVHWVVDLMTASAA